MRSIYPFGERFVEAAPSVITRRGFIWKRISIRLELDALMPRVLRANNRIRASNRSFGNALNLFRSSANRSERIFLYRLQFTVNLSNVRRFIYSVNLFY